jgi:hypothetical protein
MKVMNTIVLVDTLTVGLTMKVLADGAEQPVEVTPREVVVNSRGTQYLNLDVVVAGQPSGTAQVARLAYETMLSGATTTAGKPRSVFAMHGDRRVLLTLPASAV